jgi:NTE family protein
VLPGGLSPYQANPLNLNPLQRLIETEIDFDRLARLKSPRVFVAATDVETGRARIFSGKRLTAQAVMASCCLPQLFQAPEIDGRLYWDGGYSANPALRPLVEMGEAGDILLVQINPLRRAGRPTSRAEIADRAADLSFNASLIAQMRTIALINELVERGLAREGLAPIRMHRIDGGAALADMPAHSKQSPQRATLQQLFALGQASARRWLARSLGAVGHKSSIDLQRDYGDPLRLDFDSAPAPAAADAPATPAPFLWSAQEQARAAAHADAAARQAVRAAGGERPPF